MTPEEMEKYKRGEGLAELYYSTFPSRSTRPSDEKREKWNNAKALYLSSDNWKRIRQLKMEQCRGICEARTNGCKVYASQVHHLSYKHIGDEALWDLRAVCTHCHNKVSKKGTK